MTSGINEPSIAQENGSSSAQKKRPVPRWLPISLLAFSSVALIAPVILLRRHKANLLSRTLEEAPPPRRTTTTVSATLGAVGTSRPRQVAHTNPQIPPTTAQNTLDPAVPEAADDFNGALYSLKAFGYATLLVMAGGLTTVWGVKQYMGVDNTEEFAFRMRSLVQAKMPGLMARLYRAPTEEDELPIETHSPSTDLPSPRVVIDQHTETDEWNWPDAEKRLGAAFDQGGFSGWADAVLRELEKESKVERQKRGHT